MKKLLFITLFLPCFSFGQNLVPNPSFEDTVKCPFSPSFGCNGFYDALLDCITYWHLPTCATADYFNECAPAGNVGIPHNIKGDTVYARTGSAYCGFAVKSIVEYREYITCELTSPLVQGTTYYVEFYVAPPCKIILGDCIYGFSDGFGAHFSVGLPDTTGIVEFILPQVPQIENSIGNLMSDTVNWNKVSGTFVAAGGETHITIGNFRTNANTQGFAEYYYIDDVCVSADSLFCTYPIGINERKQMEFGIYPNPTTGKFTVANATAEIQIFDLFGRLLLRTNEEVIDMSSYPAGLYIWLVGEARGKLVKE